MTSPTVDDELVARPWIPWKPEDLVEAKLSDGSVFISELGYLNLTGKPPNGPTTIVALRFPSKALSDSTEGEV